MNNFVLKNNIKFWIFPNDFNKIIFPQKTILNKENILSKREKEHLLASYYARKTFSDLYKINSKDLKIVLKQGQAPFFEDEKMGYFSISHCKNAIILGWSKERIGIDIERMYRKTTPIIVSKRFFNKNEFEEIEKDKKLSAEKFIKTWVIKNQKNIIGSLEKKKYSTLKMISKLKSNIFL